MKAARYLSTGLIVLGAPSDVAARGVALLARAGVCFNPGSNLLAEALGQNAAITALHAGVFTHLNLQPFAVEPLPEDWPQRAALAPQRAQLRCWAERDLLTAPLWGVQAFNLGRLLPLWREALAGLPVQYGCVWLVTDPGSFIAAAMPRWRLTREQAALLWLTDVLETEAQSRALPRVLLSVTALLTTPAASLARIAAQLYGGLPGLWSAPLPEAEPAPVNLPGDDLPTWVAQAYAILCQVAEADDARHLAESLAGLRAQVRQAQALYGAYASDYHTLSAAYASQVALAQTRLVTSEALASQCLALESLNAQRQQTVAAQTHWLSALRQALHASQQSLSAAEQQVTRVHAALVAQQQSQNALQQELVRLNTHWNQHALHWADLLNAQQQQQVRLHHEHQLLQTQLQSQQRELMLIHLSLAWRAVTYYRRLLGNRLRRSPLPEALPAPSVLPPGSLPTQTQPLAPHPSVPIAPIPLPAAGVLSSSSGSFRVLVIDETVPMPDRDSGSLRAWEILRILSELGCAVTWAGHKPVLPGTYTAPIEALGIHCLHQHNTPDLGAWLHTEALGFEVVILSRAPVAEIYLGLIRRRFPQALVVFDTVDLYFVREARAARLQGHEPGFEVHRRRLVEVATARFADVTWVVSEADRRQLLAQDATIQTEIVSNIVRPKLTLTPLDQRSGIAFLGGFWHQPNVDAVLFYLREIHPLVRVALPGVPFYILGSHPTAELLAWASEDVIVTGYVPDLEPLFAALRVCVAPLRYGSGVKGKINTSLSFGVPVVTTLLGAEGMNLHDGIHALLADSPEDFARAVVRLYQDPALWHELRNQGAALLAAQFSPLQAQRTIAATLERVTYSNFAARHLA